MNEQNNLQQSEPIQASRSIWITIISVFITALIVGGGVYAWQRSILKSTEESLQKQIDALQKQVESLKQGQPVSDNSSDHVSKSVTQITDDKYNVILKENPQDSNKTDVYLKNLDSNTETFFMTIADVYSRHYHSSEYHNGNLYIIRRIGYDGYLDDTWSDELWRYNSQKKGTRLYSTKGIDFRVNDSESLITIITNEEFILLNNSGGELKSLQSVEVIANPEESPMFGFLAWGQNLIWLDNTFGPSLTGLVKIDTKTYAVTKYDLTDLLAGPEFTINVYSEQVAFSNYPALLDVDSARDYEESGTKVNLKVYDLKTNNQQQIATSITKKFEPKWINENTLEYNDPNSENRIQKIIE